MERSFEYLRYRLYHNYIQVPTVRTYCGSLSAPSDTVHSSLFLGSHDWDTQDKTHLHKMMRNNLKSHIESFLLFCFLFVLFLIGIVSLGFYFYWIFVIVIVCMVFFWLLVVLIWDRFWPCPLPLRSFCLIFSRANITDLSHYIQILTNCQNFSFEMEFWETLSIS